MRKTLSILTCLMIALVSVTRSEEPKPLPVLPVPQPTPQRVSSEAAPAKTDVSVEHLLKAAEHLDAAGLEDEAIKLRGIARQRAVHDSDLSRKEAELECLQEEVDRLRELTGQAPGVVIEIVALEVQRGKLGLKAQEFDKMIGLGSIARQPIADPAASDVATAEYRVQGIALIDANPARLPLFKELREKGIIRVLAEPTLVTTPRRPASFLSGGQIPIPHRSANGDTSIAYKSFGTQVEVVAAVLANQHLRLQTSFEFSQKDFHDSVVVEGITVPSVTTRKINTEVEMRLGQTLTIGRMVTEKNASTATERSSPDQKAAARTPAGGASSADPVETLIFITPRLIHEPVDRQASAIVPTSGLDDSETVVPLEGSRFGPTVPVLKRPPARK